LDAGNVRSWQTQIAHVPQTVFLIDDTIAANVAFASAGQDAEQSVDHNRVLAALATAQLADVIEELPNGIHTEVGERGIRLSGGQRQRIGIARAIYQAAPVLVLDEATSSLDDATEAAVMDAIVDALPEATIISVAHRSTTLARCDRIVTIKGGQIAGVARDL